MNTLDNAVSTSSSLLLLSRLNGLRRVNVQQEAWARLCRLWDACETRERHKNMAKKINGM